MSFPMVALGEVLTERKEVPSAYDLANRKIRIVSKIGFNDGRIQLRDDYETKTGMILIRPGDIVISGINAAKGAIALYDSGNKEPIMATIHYSSYIPKLDKVDPKFLWWLLRSNTFREILYEYLREGIKTELKAKRLLPIPAPLPPLSEQRRLMARIEELAAKIEEAHRLRRMAREEAEAALKSALTTIINALVEQNGSRQLNDFIQDACYGTSIKCGYERVKDSIPVLRIPNIAYEKINFDDLKYGFLSGPELSRVLIEEGDILIVRTNGSADLVGRCAVVPPLVEPTAFASYIIRLRCDRKIIAPDYLQLILKFLRTEGQLIDFARTTAGQYNVSLGRLRVAKIPAPPSLPEQHRIVAYFNALQAKMDALRRLQAETSAELDALLPAVLDRAFKGQL